jgi:hypothetical protein
MSSLAFEQEMYLRTTHSNLKARCSPNTSLNFRFNYMPGGPGPRGFGMFGPGPGGPPNVSILEIGIDLEVKKYCVQWLQTPTTYLAFT